MLILHRDHEPPPIWKMLVLPLGLLAMRCQPGEPLNLHLVQRWLCAQQLIMPIVFSWMCRVFRRADMQKLQIWIQLERRLVSFVLSKLHDLLA